MKTRKILTSQSAKMAAGFGRGIEGLILYLAPDMFEGKTNCPWSTAGCRAVCLGETSGRMVMDNARKARAWRTRMMRQDPIAFWNQIRSEIAALSDKAGRKGAQAAVRLDGTSDLDLARTLTGLFPDVIFYDYTKSHRRMREWLEARARGEQRNRWITFSRSESNESDALDILARGGDVAVVFSTKKGEALPKEWKGYRVINGDADDWRFLDARRVRKGQGLVVGLRAKGAARRDESGFVVKVGA